MTEPEEKIEARLVALIAAAVPAMDVVGALAPCEQGDMKLAGDSCVSVYADVASQDLDFTGRGLPFTYSVRAVLRVAFADDKTGALFRDSARAVRGVFAALSGDGCSALDGDGFTCDAFILDGTQTSLDGTDGAGAMTKTYSATVKGRDNTKQED